MRGGGQPQSCHLTDPSHPDHIKAGASPNAKAKECPGAVILIMREAARAVEPGTREVNEVGIKHYQKHRKKGLTKHGLLYWLVQRITMAGVPFMGGPKLPEVDVDDPEIGLPDYLEEKECGV